MEDDGDNHCNVGSANVEEEEAGEKTCRICLEDDDDGDPVDDEMIAPCKCKGSSRWVHRKCLDMWRIREEDRAFSKCTECLFEYRLVVVGGGGDEEEEDDDDNNNNTCCTLSKQCMRRSKFMFFVTRDVCLSFIVVQLFICLVAFIVWSIDRQHQIPSNLFGGGNGTASSCILSPSDDKSDTGDNNFWWCNHELSIYYVCGVIVLLILLGLVGSIILCSNNCSIAESISVLENERNQQQRYNEVLSSSEATQPSSTMIHQNSIPPMRSRVIQGGRGERRTRTRYRSIHNSSYYRNNRRYYQNRSSRRSCCKSCCDDITMCCHSTDRCCFIDLHIDSDSCCRGGSCNTCAGGSSGGGNNGSDDCLHIVIVILCLLAIVMAVIGFFVGIMISVIVCQRIIQRHIHITQKKILAREFQVMDLSNYNLSDIDRYDANDDETIIVDIVGSKHSMNTSSSSSSSLSVVESGIPLPAPIPVPSAPPNKLLNADEKMYLQKLGLMD